MRQATRFSHTVSEEERYGCYVTGSDQSKLTGANMTSHDLTNGRLLRLKSPLPHSRTPGLQSAADGVRVGQPAPHVCTAGWPTRRLTGVRRSVPLRSNRRKRGVADGHNGAETGRRLTGVGGGGGGGGGGEAIHLSRGHRYGVIF